MIEISLTQLMIVQGIANTKKDRKSFLYYLKNLDQQYPGLLRKSGHRWFINKSILDAAVPGTNMEITSMEYERLNNRLTAIEAALGLSEGDL